MLIRISSGIHAPIECEHAVYLLASKFENDFNVERYGYMPSVQTANKNCFKSITLRVPDNIEPIDGTVEWICKSPYRENCKRKNWFIDVSSIRETITINAELVDNILYETFRSGGNGGQNVNKVETGVRGRHIPTGISFTSTSERSQYLNKKNVEEKIKQALNDINSSNSAKTKNEEWAETNKLVRGNPIMVFEGKDFKRIK